MKILISGASGLIGKELLNSFKAKGINSIPFLRKNLDNFPYYSIDDNFVDLKGSDFDVVIHLAGENIAKGRWTKNKKNKIMDSRVLGTKLISEYFSKLEKKPKLFISASAIGYYGDTKGKYVDEKSKNGEGFLANVCNEWENATEAVKKSGIRVVNLRLGPVLSGEGGMLKKMLLPFKLGLGGYIGNGQQIFNWIAIEDLISIIHFIIVNEEIEGAVNCISPKLNTNKEFSKILGSILNRPVLFGIPKIILKMILGKMAEELLFASCGAVPKKLLDYEFSFEHDELRDYLSKCLLK